MDNPDHILQARHVLRPNDGRAWPREHASGDRSGKRACRLHASDGDSVFPDVTEKKADDGTTSLLGGVARS